MESSYFSQTPGAFQRTSLFTGIDGDPNQNGAISRSFRHNKSMIPPPLELEGL